MHDGHDIGLRQATTGVQIVAERTSRRIDEVSRAIHHVILREVDELGGDQHLVDILHNSVSANVSTIVHALRYAIDAAHYEVPVVAAEYARRLAQHNVPLEALIRAYRLGQTEFLPSPSTRRARSKQTLRPAWCSHSRSWIRPPSTSTGSPNVSSAPIHSSTNAG